MKPKSLKLRVAHLYPKLMNIYGDRGNILCLKLRCEQRGIGFDVEELELGDKLSPKNHDLVFAGGAQDREQLAPTHQLARHGRRLNSPEIDDPGHGPNTLYQIVEGTRRLCGLLPTGRGLTSLFWSIRCDLVEAWRKSEFAGWRETIRAYAPKAAPLLDQIREPEQVHERLHRGLRRGCLRKCAASAADNGRGPQ